MHLSSAADFYRRGWLFQTSTLGASLYSRSMMRRLPPLGQRGSQVSMPPSNMRFSPLRDMLCARGTAFPAHLPRAREFDRQPEAAARMMTAAILLCSLTRASTIVDFMRTFRSISRDADVDARHDESPLIADCDISASRRYRDISSVMPPPSLGLCRRLAHARVLSARRYRSPR